MNTDSLVAFISALADHQWPLAVGLGISLAVYIANRFGLQNKVGAKYVPWIAAGLGILSSIGVQLATGIPWEEAIGKGFTAGATSVGLWEMILKNLLPAVPPTPPTPPSA
jgi:hypothetical protein